MKRATRNYLEALKARLLCERLEWKWRYYFPLDPNPALAEIVEAIHYWTEYATARPRIRKQPAN